MQLDWIEGSITGKPAREVLQALSPILGGMGWQPLDHGGYGYESSAIVCETGRVYWSYVHPEQGVHVSLPSSAIGNWCSCTGHNPRELLFDMSRCGLRASRCDFAFDDRSGVLKMGEIGQAVESGCVVSRFRKRSQIRSWKGSDRCGETWGFGSRESESYVRVYDKAAEQGVEGPWVRVELELKGERAAHAVELLLFHTACGEWSEQVASWLYGLLDFKEPGIDSNKSRWETSEWWRGFLGACEKLGLCIPKTVRTVEDLKTWVERQVAPALFVLCMVFGYDEVLRLIACGSNRLRPKHRVMLAIKSS